MNDLKAHLLNFPFKKNETFFPFRYISGGVSRIDPEASKKFYSTLEKAILMIIFVGVLTNFAHQIYLRDLDNVKIYVLPPLIISQISLLLIAKNYTYYIVQDKQTAFIRFAAALFSLVILLLILMLKVSPGFQREFYQVAGTLEARRST